MSKSNFVKKFVALASALYVMLVPFIAMAQEKTEKPDNEVAETVRQYAKKGYEFVEPYIGFDFELKYWWAIVFVTFPLTIAWQILSSANTRKNFNDFGGMIVCGVPALALVVIFYGTVAYVVLRVFWVIIGLINLSLNLSISGIWHMLITLIMLVPLMILYKILDKAGAIEFVKKEVLARVAELAKTIWGKRISIYENPHLVWEVIGGSVIAFALNGKLAVHLTKDAPFMGLIPAISGVVGLVFIVYRTGFKKLADRAVGKLPPGYWKCDLVADKPLYNEHLWKTQRILQPLLNPDGSQKWEKGHKCGAVNEPEYESCCKEYCDNTPGWTCPHCGYKGEDIVKELPPEKEGGKPKLEITKSKGIPWDKKTCPKCHTAQPERPKQFHFPDKDIFSAPEAVLPTGDGSAAPVATAPVVAAPVATAPASTTTAAPAEAGFWVSCSCGEMNYLHKSPQCCTICGGKLRGPAPVVSPPDPPKNRAIPSLYEVWWRKS